MKKRYFCLIFILSFVIAFFENTAAQNQCDLTGFVTYTQGGWGSDAHPGNPGAKRDQLFPQAFPQGLTIGGHWTIKLTTSLNAAQYLRSKKGTPGPLIKNYVNPTETEAGNLGTQLTALKLNIAYDATLAPKQYLLTDLVITNGKFQGKTVAEFMALAEAALGGADISGAGYTYSDLNYTATRINENFDNGTTNKNFLTCPENQQPEKASLGDRVWFDENNNGIQDENEQGISSIVVKLYNCSDNSKIKEALTDSEGYYLFDGLEPGQYRIEVIIPGNYSVSPQYEGHNDELDSDIDNLGKSACITLASGENNLSIDAGLTVKQPMKASIGNYIWADLNDNGIQDDGDSGIEGITVQLYNCTGELLKTTTTNFEGYYYFHDVPQGNYYVKITVPGNYSVGKMNQESNDALDSDFPPEGQTSCFAFAGTNDDYTIDCALVRHLFTDLEVKKTASNLNVQCGELFSYTVTVKNKGPVSASDIVVADILPSGADFQSFSASHGTYLQTSGEWHVGNLDNGQSASLTLNVMANCSALQPGSIDLGAAKGFNLFVLENLSQPSADTQGKIAVGGNATLSNYSVGDLLPPNSGDVLIVGGTLIFTSGSVSNGNVVCAGTTNLPQYAVSITGGILKHGNPVNFPAAKIFLQNLSQTLAAFFPNGSVRFEWGTLTLKGTDPNLNVFTVAGSDISAAHNFILNVPKGSSALVSISGQNVKWTGGLELIGADVSKVIYNFFQAQTLKIQGIDVRGTVLAPQADVDFPSGLVTGEMIAKSVTGSGQFNNDPWDGNLPSSKSFINTASLKGSIPQDNNPANNSSSVTVNAGLTSDQVISGIAERETLPLDYNLKQNYPNPFNPSTTIEFAVPQAGRFTLKIFNMLGQEVTTLLDRDLSAGYHKAVFDASKVPSGIYFYRLTGNNVYLIRKMILAK